MFLIFKRFSYLLSQYPKWRHWMATAKHDPVHTAIKLHKIRSIKIITRKTKNFQAAWIIIMNFQPPATWLPPIKLHSEVGINSASCSEVSHSDHSLETSYYDWSVSIFSQHSSPRQKDYFYNKLFHDHFLPHICTALFTNNFTIQHHVIAIT